MPLGITRLTIDSGERSLFADSYLQSKSRKIFLNLLKEFRDLQSLKITCASFSDLPVLKKAFKSFRSLKSLEITFDKTSCTSDRSCLQDFIKAFSQRLNQLKVAFLESHYLRGQRGDCRSYLRNCHIDRLNNLQKLSLHFPIFTVLQEKKKDSKGRFNPIIRYIDLSPMKRLNRLKS